MDLAVDAATQLAIQAAPGEPIFVTEDGEDAHVHHYRIDDEWVAIPVVGLPRSKQFQAAKGAGGRKYSGGRVGDEELRNVARAYRAALVEGKPPTATVAEELHVSRSTAGRYVQRAREKGFLGPTRPRLAGEQL